MDRDALLGLLLFNDGLGLVATVLMAEFFERRKDRSPVYTLYVFFRVLFVVFGLLTTSDMLRVAQIDLGFFTSSVGRGLMFRGPITVATIWALYRCYGVE